LSKRVKTLKEYLGELKQTRKDKPEQIKEALGIYLELWDTAIEKGIVGQDDSMDDALSKVEQKGGLYQAASSQATG
jgi:hypothetical protein